MNQVIVIILCIILECYASFPMNVIMDQIEDGPLKNNIQHPQKGWFFKTNEQTSAEYILDILHRSGTNEVDEPIRTVGGYWGNVIEMMTLIANRNKMKNAVDQLLVNQPDNIKSQEFDKISHAQQKIKQMYHNTLIRSELQ